MKATIITFAAAILLSFGSTFGNNNSKIYKNTTIDKQNNTETTTVYEGENDTRLKPIKQYTISYDQAGNITERKICRWDNDSRSWINAHKYMYSCNANGHIVILGYTVWDQKLSQWKEDATYAVYTYGIGEENNLVINYIKADTILNNYMSLK